MTDIEFAKEVAEKVWKWNWIMDTPGRCEYWERPDDISFHGTREEINDEVNSWAGFGRTVEVLANQKLPKRLTDKYVAFYIDYLRGHISIEEFIKATHQAALDALKGDKDEGSKGSWPTGY